MRRIIFALTIILALASKNGVADSRAPIKIGALFSLSSWGAQGGQSELNGAMLAAEDVNAKGGVNGRPLELVVEDNHSELKDSAAGFRKLISVDNVPAVIGPNWVEFIDVVAPLAASEKVPVVTPSGYKDRHIKPDPWVFVLWPPPSVATKLLADTIFKHNITKVSGLISENAYYQSMFSSLRPQLESRGIIVVDTLSFAPGTLDYRSALLRLSKNGSQGVISFLLETGEFAAFLKQRREQKFALPLFGANTIPFDPIVQKDLGLANGLIYFDYIALGTPDFFRRYEERFKSSPGVGSAKAYDGLLLIAESMKECGLERPNIRECLRRAKLDGVSGHIEFDQRGVLVDSTPNAKLFEVVGGKIMELGA